MNQCLPKGKGFGGNAQLENHRHASRHWFRKICSPESTQIPVTLICVDTTDRVDLAARAVRECVSQSSFSAVKLLTHDLRYPHAVQIPRLQGIEAYSHFMIRELHKYVDTSHALIVQWDGYVCDASRWSPLFLNYDYIGAPWFQWHGLVGNGGFSLRSKRLLEHLAKTDYPSSPHPEDSYICMRHRQALEGSGFKFAPTDLAAQFAIESRVYSREKGHWQGSPKTWNNHFGFHSYLTPLPDNMDRPLVFHHGGDYGDVIYALPTIKALGGGIIFMSPDNRYPYPQKPRGAVDAHWVGNIAPLLHQQPYIWQALHTGILPYSVDFDLNAFREYYRTANRDNFTSLLQLHLKKFGVYWDETKPWLRVDQPNPIAGRPIVVNRTQRYQNDQFPWGDLVDKYRDQMIFIGTNEEYGYFKGFSPHKPVPLLQTPNLLDVARAIAGCKVFIGNQSTPMAIALGLGKNVIQEVWLSNANCVLCRENALYVRDSSCDIPASWLK